MGHQPAYRHRPPAIDRSCLCWPHENTPSPLLACRCAAAGTALFWASSRGHANIVHHLLQTTAAARDDINSPNSKGLTPLIVSSQHGHPHRNRPNPPLFRRRPNPPQHQTSIRPPPRRAWHGTALAASVTIAASAEFIFAAVTSAPTLRIFVDFIGSQNLAILFCGSMMLKCDSCAVNMVSPHDVTVEARGPRSQGEGVGFEGTRLRLTPRRDMGPRWR